MRAGLLGVLLLQVLAARAVAQATPSAAPPVDAARLPLDRVVVHICEDGVPVKEVWPEAAPKAAEEYDAEAFAFFRIPQKYVDTGIRGDRPNPFLLRAAAVVELPEGKHRILLRGRGASRLFIDGREVLATRFPPPITDGHNEIPTDYLDLGPDFRFAPPGNREKWTTFASKGQRHLVVLEAILGGKRGGGMLRPEPGETVVAIALESETTFRLLAPRVVVPYTDDAWKPFAVRENKRLDDLEAQRRKAAFAAHGDIWTKRHEAARRWLDDMPRVVVPPLPAGYPAHNAVDHFLAAKIEAAKGAPMDRAGAIDFVKQIRPILEARCFSCHEGKKTRGGLRLDAEGARRGGDSTRPAVVPGQPEKSELLRRILTKDKTERMPPTGDPLSAKEVALLDQWLREGASWSTGPRAIKITDLADDLTFLRRVTLDTVGVIPTPDEIERFLTDKAPGKRDRVIDRLLADPRWADHWVGYWQDVLAENPNILNPTLNNTGPFRWWIYEAMLDNKPMDLFVTELVLMRGSHYQGGPAGFAMASQSDAPMAEKAAILSSAFLGIQMKCARCHDAPGHKSTQKDLFQLAALLEEKALAVPKTSSVPVDKLHKGRKALIQVTLKPGQKIEPDWPFAAFATSSPWLDRAATPRERLAALLTAPSNERFAQVIANRLWKRLMGRGLIEPVDDWEKGEATHPELLRYLGRELVAGGYDLKRLARLILTSHAYQRAVDPELKAPDPLHAAVAKRRLSAEQIVDSLFLAAGKTLDTEEVNLDVDGGRDMKNSINLGKPRRAWMFASTSNERDRPSLALPRVQAVVDVLEAFGWRPARQFPLSDRETDPNVLQPAILANGVMGTWLTRLSDDHGVTRLALQEQPPHVLVDQLFLNILTRQPTNEEREQMLGYLAIGYSGRKVDAPPEKRAKRTPPKYVSWSNHLTPEANRVKVEMEEAARRGAPPTRRLEAPWRERLEDALWALLNSPEFVFRP